MGPTFQEFSNFWKILRKRKNLTGRVHHDVAMASWWPNPRRRRPQRRCVRASREARLGASGAPRRGLPVGGGAAASAGRSVAGDVETRRRPKLTPATIPPCVRRLGTHPSARTKRERRRCLLRRWIRRGRRGAAPARVGGGGDSGVARKEKGREGMCGRFLRKGP